MEFKIPTRRCGLSTTCFPGSNKGVFLSHKPANAFTLLELLVVCAIIALILAFTIPAVTGISKGNSLSSGGRLVSNLLSVARSEAINQRRLTQLRVVTKWMNSNGTEDSTASYRKFSVWRRPLPGDAQQSVDPADPYVQVSKWETLPAGVTFEKDTSTYNLPTAGDPRNPGTYFLTPALGKTKSGIKVPGGTADVAWIEFAPTGAANYSGTVPAKVYLLLTDGFWDGTSIVSTQSNHANWLVATVDTLIGRISILRP